MILIFSTAGDPSTIDVIRWIHHLSDAKVVRVNSDVTYRVDLTFDGDDYLVRVDDDEFRLADVSSAWLRKGDFWFRGLFPPVTVASSALGRHLGGKLRREDRTLRDHFHYVLRQRCSVLGSASGSTPNKLVVLELARKLGLHTPPFHVSTSRRFAQDLLDGSDGHVSKAMSDGVFLFDARESMAGYFTYTERLSAASLEGVGERMAPSFFQSYVEKRFELRIFFLDDQFYSVAIFSQGDDQTKVDYRKYNVAKPNRVIPYQLPADTEAKLLQLACELGLNTGSFDMIADDQGRLWLLEVNPVGQFGGNSESCNLAIERRIAQRLLAHEQ